MEIILSVILGVVLATASTILAAYISLRAVGITGILLKQICKRLSLALVAFSPFLAGLIYISMLLPIEYVSVIVLLCGILLIAGYYTYVMLKIKKSLKSDKDNRDNK